MKEYLTSFTKYHQLVTNPRVFAPTKEKVLTQEIVSVENGIERVREYLVNRASFLQDQKRHGKNTAIAEKELETIYNFFESVVRLMESQQKVLKTYMAHHNREVEKLEKTCWELTKTNESFKQIIESDTKQLEFLTHTLIQMLAKNLEE